MNFHNFLLRCKMKNFEIGWMLEGSLIRCKNKHFEAPINNSFPVDNSWINSQFFQFWNSHDHIMTIPIVYLLPRFLHWTDFTRCLTSLMIVIVMMLWIWMQLYQWSLLSSTVLDLAYSLVIYYIMQKPYHCHTVTNEVTDCKLLRFAVWSKLH